MYRTLSRFAKHQTRKNRVMPHQQLHQRNATCKDLWIVRHGQATHNPRAEAARANGCSFDEFVAMMKQDDSVDCELTALGVEQAQDLHQQYQHLWAPTTSSKKSAFDLVVASPLSRALHTADLALPPSMASHRICHETFREINGYLLNAKRRSRKELSDKFPHWNFDLLQSEQDTQWTDEFEERADCKERGYRGLCWILGRPEERIFLVTHGGFLRYSMAEFPEKVTLADNRQSATNGRMANDRFQNCEVRRYRLEWEDGDISAEDERQQKQDEQHQSRKVLLTEIDILQTSADTMQDIITEMAL